VIHPLALPLAGLFCWLQLAWFKVGAHRHQHASDFRSFKRPQVPSPLGCEILGPAGAAMGEVITVADQPLMQLAGEQGNAVHPSVVAEQWQTATTCRPICARKIKT
jgi:hypothetical protein